MRCADVEDRALGTWSVVGGRDPAAARASVLHLLWPGELKTGLSTPLTLVIQINHMERDIGGALLERAERRRLMSPTLLGDQVLAALQRVERLPNKQIGTVLVTTSGVQGVGVVAAALSTSRPPCLLIARS